MRSFLSPTLQISFALMSLTISLLMSAQVLGILPSQSESQLAARAQIAEALAIHLSTAAAKNDLASINATLSSVVEREKTILSAAIRKADETLLAHSGDHAIQWAASSSDNSTSTHIRVPIRNSNTDWGRVEIVFSPLDSSTVLAIVPSDIVPLIVFLGLVGFVGYYFVLRNALREIDPSNAIHQRVQAAFNALTEGVLVVDEREKILLANAAISETFGLTPEALINTKTSALNWRQWTNGDDRTELPWRTAIKTGEQVTGTSISIRAPSGDLQLFSVNAAPIIDGRGRVYGAIATFDNVTGLQRKNEQLRQANRQLKETQSEVRRQNNELRYLASRDPLSGCLNRRSLFAGLEPALQRARAEQIPLSIVMVDIDHFKGVNDNYGHSVGDEVIANVGALLRNCSRKEDLVGRYGGEEFCLVLHGQGATETASAAERIRLELMMHSPSWLPDGRQVTASLGVALLGGQQCTPADLVEQADKALYEAKRRGRNQVVFWHDVGEATPEAVGGEGARSEGRQRNGMSQETPTHQSNDVAASVLDHRLVAAHTHAHAQIASATPESFFLNHLDRSIARSQRQRTNIAVLHLTVGLPQVVLEGSRSDAISTFIAQISKRASGVLRGSDTISLCGPDFSAPLVSQLAGTSFGIEISDLEEIDSITWIVERLQKALSSQVELDGHPIELDISMGISIFPRDGATAMALLDHARSADEHNRIVRSDTGYSFYSPELNRRSKQSLQIEKGLRRALERDELSLVYQPILNLESGNLTSAEALMRCNSADLRNFQLDELISVGEQTGLIIKMSERLMLKGISQYRRWQAQGIYLPKLSLNVSPVQLRDPEASEHLVQFVHGLDMPAKHLQFEVTETTFIEDVRSVRESMQRLQNLGVQIALDDFGTGHSSLSHLREFQPDVLKIDRSFISRIESSRNDATMVSAIIAMCHQMGIVVVAEGVETEAQLNRLKYLQCDDFQGYLSARPMTEGDMTKWLKTHFANRATRAA